MSSSPTSAKGSIETTCLALTIKRRYIDIELGKVSVADGHLPLQAASKPELGVQTSGIGGA